MVSYTVEPRGQAPRKGVLGLPGMAGRMRLYGRVTG
jgi:hypothetical protein